MQEKENGHTSCKMKCMYDAANWEIKERQAIVRDHEEWKETTLKGRVQSGL